MAEKVTVFAGHYGSGKTNIAVNYALKLRDWHERVAIADLDIVNPYFRTKDSADILEKNGVRLIVSEFAGTNLDAPAFPAEAYSVIDDDGLYSVIDVGGDDRGALALGRFSEALERIGYDMLFVVNPYRPLTRDPESAFEYMREIESAASLRFTGIAANPNLGDLTEASHIEASYEYMSRLSLLSGLPVAFTAVREDIAKTLPDPTRIFPIKIYVTQSFAGATDMCPTT